MILATITKRKHAVARVFPSTLTAILNRNFGSFSKYVSTMQVDQSTRDAFAHSFADPYADPDEVQKISSKIIGNCMRESDLRKIEDFSKLDQEAVIMLFKDSPRANPLPPTPTNDREIAKNKGFQSELFSLGVLDLLGANLYVGGDEKGGHAFQNIFPTNPEAISSAGSKKAFNAHTENAHDQTSPIDFLLLSCLRGNPNAATTFWPLHELLNKLPLPIIEELKKPNFLFRTGDSFDIVKESRGSILTESERGFDIRINTAPGRTQGLTPESRHALEVVNKYLENEINIGYVILDNGDLAVVKNKKTLHGRSAYQETDDGTTQTEDRKVRWVFRGYGTERIALDSDSGRLA